MTQYRTLSQEYCIHNDVANDEQLIHTQSGYSNDPATFHRQLASRRENVLCPFVASSDGMSCTSHFEQFPVLNDARIWKVKERNNMGIHDDPSRHFLTDFNFQYKFSQAGNGQVLWPQMIFPNGTEDLDFWSTTDSSPQSPVGNFHVPFCGNEHSQPDNSQVPCHLPISPSAAAGPLTSSTTTIASSARSPVAPSASGLHVNPNDDIRTVGSPQIQQAAARRRKKDGAYQCALGNCNQTFTELHNLQYHINSHLALKPYECTKCSYAAASPATLKRHMKRHQ